MITCFKFKDMIDITYHSNTDTLYLSFSDGWIQKHSIFNNSRDCILEYEKRTTNNLDDLENNIVSVILKLYHDEDFCYISGCYLYYPKYNPNSGYTGVCANCFEERTLERLKAINFPTEKSGQLVNYKYYTVAGTMNRNELEQFMSELGIEKYCNGTLMSIDKDLNILELDDIIDSRE